MSNPTKRQLDELESRTRRNFIKDLAKVSAALAAVHMAQHIAPDESEAQRVKAPATTKTHKAVRMDKAGFERRLFTDSNFLRTFCNNPSGTMKSAGLAVPSRGVPRSVQYDAAQYVVNSINSRWGSFDRWAGAHGNLAGGLRGKVAVAAVCAVIM